MPALQKISARTPITTAKPIRKMTPIVPPMNFNMFRSPLSLSVATMVRLRGRLAG
jgi:hypothetical protein